MQLLIYSSKGTIPVLCTFCGLILSVYYFQIYFVMIYIYIHMYMYKFTKFQPKKVLSHIMTCFFVFKSRSVILHFFTFHKWVITQFFTFHKWVIITHFFVFQSRSSSTFLLYTNGSSSPTFLFLKIDHHPLFYFSQVGRYDQNKTNKHYTMLIMSRNN